MKDEAYLLRRLVAGMRDAYDRGENVMAFAREELKTSTSGNEVSATLIAYDLQSGSYVAEARSDPARNTRWCEQMASIVTPLLEATSSLLEVGCGEATTLAGLLTTLGERHGSAFGFDVSWSRVDEGRRWLEEREVQARLFVGDLFEVPLAGDSVDVVYTSHSIEPNGGREAEAIRELLRVARKWVVLVEPAYELASSSARRRMEKHGYVRGLRAAAEECGAKIVEHRLLDYSPNPLNPSGVLVLEKQSILAPATVGLWRCPITHTPLSELVDAFFASEVGIAYPVLRGIPMLRSEHAIIASRLVRQPSPR